jgi:hypothetical protein
MQANEVHADHRSSIGHAFRTASPSSHGGSPIFATADPHHQRAPSLGELHQELEQEQEAQVVGGPERIIRARSTTEGKLTTMHCRTACCK